ncbi:hypothetical protein [Alkalispirochaeta americana]|uniref:hypothetical protein n=1 Tax=Alkalispirochaeta americana TaxID=159291 RepID=UPI00117A279E|nr:hypothetical protein [Alkalispirochaeta americana]
MVADEDRYITGTERRLSRVTGFGPTTEHHYIEVDYHYDLGVHVVNVNEEWVVFNLYPMQLIRFYFEDAERKAIYATLTGTTPDFLNTYALFVTTNSIWELYRGWHGERGAYPEERQPGRIVRIPFYHPQVDGGEEPELSRFFRRMYMLRYMYENRFAMTVALDEDVDFRATEVGVGEGERVGVGEGERVWYSRTPKDSLLPTPVNNFEVLPSNLWILELQDTFPPEGEDHGEYSISPVPLDLSEYGIPGELGEDDLFRIQEHLGYSVYLERIAFAARIMSDDGETFREYIFLVPEEGGTPEVLVEMCEGYTLEDMLFSPDGRELALQVDDEVYIISGFEASR